MQTGSVHSEGAELVFDTQGTGGPLLFIPGGNGEAASYRPIADQLAGRFTVITYDRRGFSRSSGDVTADLNMAQQARDVVAVMRAAGYERSLVFGSSAGANIGLKLAADHPNQVAALLAHEPPVLRLLPDAAAQVAFTAEVHRVFLAQGPQPAMKLFMSQMVGFSAGHPVPNAQQRQNSSFFLGKELLNIADFVPDLAAIRVARVEVTMLRGALSGEAFYARTVPIVAEQLGCPVVTVPGNHLGYLLESEAFAQMLRGVLASYPFTNLVA
ncbi:alpha/beta hydrolase [Hymenobacter sp. BT664]|uniref:Alpha/beta hydrolase n=1 Tax=Hymenobacter montanus TaxID=2771359 RepID=A0A927BB88_9BACT|nr:alpha/beta hydrolase [Hymenobacter montanus]MBD2766843.1 alpha/beta hydrolase [Hymenobacter montanus]